MKLVPQAGLPLETLRAAGLKGKGGLTLIKNFATLFPGMADAFSIARKHKPVAAFGVGGYAAGPMLLATWLRGIPNVIFEPNAEPGFTNKVLARLSRKIATGYSITSEKFGAKAVLTGNPVRSEFFAIAPRKPQGALPINRAVVDAMDRLAARKSDLSVVHQTGERDYNAVRTAYARREFNAEVVPFLSNMAERFAWADLIVCRAGAITAAELAAAGRAAIFIPFGRATDSHQLRNAQEMVKAQAARLIVENELTADRLASEIFSLLDQPRELEQLSSNARSLGKPSAARDIVDLIDQAAGLQRKGRAS